MSLSFQQERIATLLQELPDLLFRHWKETAMDQDKLIFDPDWRRLITSDETGQLFVFTARDAGKLVGYFIAFLAPHIHYRTTLSAFTDGVYIVPEYRVAGNGVKLFRQAEAILKRKGVERLGVSCTIRMDISRLLFRLGYHHVENGFVKYLK